MPKLRALTYDPARGRLEEWLAAVIWQLAAGAARAPRRKVGEQPLSEASHAALAAPAADPLAEMASAEEESALRREVDAAFEALRRRVSPSCYRLVELHVIDGLGLSESAAALGLARNQAKCQRRHARRKLREIIRCHPEWSCLNAWGKRA